MNILKVIEMYTLNGQIIWYVNSVSVKLLEKIKVRRAYLENIGGHLTIVSQFSFKKICNKNKNIQNLKTT